jgi:lysophospholipase L1-like esterase
VDKDITAFEKSDAANTPPKRALLFIGSSTIARWKSLATDFPGATILNRAFGGNEIADSTHFAERMIFPYQPRMIFHPAGGNDIHAGKSAEEVFHNYKTFVATVRAKLPDVPIAYIALSPSPARWKEKAAGDQLNAAIADYSKKTKNLIFIDAASITLDADGEIRRELFVADQLHFNEEGYKLLAEAVRPHVPR